MGHIERLQLVASNSAARHIIAEVVRQLRTSRSRNDWSNRLSI